MLFKLIILTLIISCSFKDNNKKDLEKDIDNWKRLMGRDYN